jgi:hypothetical protein
MASWAHRTVLAGLLLAAYLFAWTPARTAWTRTAATVLNMAAPAATDVSARPTTHVVQIQLQTGTVFSYTAPAGVKFLLAGFALVFIAPTRPPLGTFFGGYLVLGGLTCGLAVAECIGLPGGLGLARFMQTYGVDAYSLSVPVLVVAHRQSPRPTGVRP